MKYAFREDPFKNNELTRFRKCHSGQSRMALPELRLIGGIRYIQDRPAYLLISSGLIPRSLLRYSE